MSLTANFSKAKGAFRRRAAALGIAAIATLFAANATQAANFTPHECKVIAGVAGKVVRELGKDTLSLQFRQSFRNFIDANATCTGPTNIATPKGPDIDAFNVMRGILASGEKPIDLYARGVRAVATLAMR
jgi:hypothetical protein